VQEGVLLLRGRAGAVNLRIDEHMREEEVVVTHVLVVARGIVSEVGPPDGKEVAVQVSKPVTRQFMKSMIRPMQPKL
jgi:hypothetical protein